MSLRKKIMLTHAEEETVELILTGIVFRFDEWSNEETVSTSPKDTAKRKRRTRMRFWRYGANIFMAGGDEEKVEEAPNQSSCERNTNYCTRIIEPLPVVSPIVTI